MKLKKKMKRMLEANLMNVILATEQQGLKKLMIHFVNDFMSLLRFCHFAILHL